MYPNLSFWGQKWFFGDGPAPFTTRTPPVDTLRHGDSPSPYWNLKYATHCDTLGKRLVQLFRSKWAVVMRPRKPHYASHRYVCLSVCLSVCRPIPCQPLINSKTEQRIGLATTFRLAGSRPNWQIKFRSQVRGHVGGNLKIVFGAYFGENASIPIRDGRGLPDNRNIFG